MYEVKLIDRIGVTVWVITTTAIAVCVFIPVFCYATGTSNWFTTEEFTELFRYPFAAWVLFSVGAVVIQKIIGRR